MNNTSQNPELPLKTATYQITSSALDSPDALMLLEALSKTLETITGSSGKASFDPAEMQGERTCFVIARNASGEPVGCGAIRPLQEDIAELKRMYAVPGYQGIGSAVLAHLEHAARQLGYRTIWLETRKVNTRAVAFYARNGYALIPNYGRYAGRNEAVCFGKPLAPQEQARMPTAMRQIEAGTLHLEPLTSAHAAEMFGALSDPAIYEFENAPPESETWLQARYTRLEQRGPADGSEIWLNWVIHLPDGTAAGYVQATLLPEGIALIAYELASRFWRRGIASTAVAAMLGELHEHYAIHTALAVLKSANFRSMGLLRKLGFTPADEATLQRYRDTPDESVMQKTL